MVQFPPYVVHLAIVHEILDIEHISAQKEKWNVPKEHVLPALWGLSLDLVSILEWCPP